jgi:hypothetical protein
MIRDPRVRRAYVLTKVGVFAAAALATLPLSNVFGARAWWGLGVFGVVLGAVTIGVLASGRSSGVERHPTGGERHDEEPDPERPVLLPIEDSIDLHPFSPRDIPKVVEDYIAEALEHGFQEVRLIHGRGIGFQRDRVRSILESHPMVEDFHDAPPSAGGWGATIAHLRRG